MRARFALLAAVAAALAVPLLAAPIPKKDAPKDEALIQGTWRIDALEAGPIAPPPEEVKAVRFTFKDGKLTITGVPNGKDAGGEQGEYKLDATTKPKQIDLTHNGQTSPGIYELDGDTFKICFGNGPKTPRPEEFKANGTSAMVFVFKRVKDEDKNEDKKDEPKAK